MPDLLIRIVRLAGRLALRAGLAFAVLVLIAIGVGPWTGAYRTTTVLTGSMRPGMPPGSVAVITPVAPSALRVGDVVTYQAPIADHRVVTHRVVRIVEPGEHPVIQTKGDANNGPDPWLARITSAEAWKRRAVVPYLGTAIRLMRSPRVHAATVYGAPALLVLGWLAHIWAGDETEPAPAAPIPRPVPVLDLPGQDRRRRVLLGLAAVVAVPVAASLVLRLRTDST